MIFPKVTRSIIEFCKLSRLYKRPLSTYGLNGLYKNKVIWWNVNSPPETILHEFIHFILKRPQEKFMHVSILLFFDILDTIHDFINGFIRYKTWRNNVHKGFNEVITAWNDWLDWMLCRDIGL